MIRLRSYARPLHRALGLAAAAFLFAACGASINSAPPVPAPTPLSDIDSALVELDRAEREISLHVSTEQQPVAAPEPSAPDQPGEPPPATGSPATAPSPEVQVNPRSGADSPASSAMQTNDSCTIACRALASMERATSHLCSLAGEDDPRCAGARSRVRNATDRVRSGCSDCSA